MTRGMALLERLSPFLQDIRGRLTPDAGMDQITWLRVGGTVDLLFQPADEADLSAFLRAVPADIPVLPIGVGSNLLVRDGGVSGIVIRLSAKGFGDIEVLESNRIRAGAAVPDKRLASAALDAGIGGLHFYYGIPGVIGGALRMNAGANGVETSERVVEIRALDRQGDVCVLNSTHMGFTYRHSNAPMDLIFVSAVFEGYADEQDRIRANMEEVQAHRESVQPIREKTGGSTFKNPPGHSAWRLIDEAGCRGLAVGGAQMSPLHCNFMINTGSATSHDLELLGETVRARVLEVSGLKLEWEIHRLGQFRQGHEIAPFLGRVP